MISQQDIASAVYDLGSGTLSWDGLLALIAERHPLARLALVVAGPDERTRVVHHAIRGYDANFINSYVAYYQNINTWTRLHRRVDEQAPVYTTRDDIALPVQRDLLKSEFFNDWVKPQDNISEGVGMLLGSNGQGSVSVTANVPRQAADETLSAIKADFLALVKPLRLVMSTQLLRSDLIIQKNNFELTLASLRDAACVLSGEGMLLFANAAAHELINSSSDMRLLGSGEINLSQVLADGNTLQNIAISHILKNGMNSFMILRSDGRRPLIAHAIPLEGYSILPDKKYPKYILFIKNPEAQPELPSVAEVARFLNLTPSEARIALQLTRGGRTADVARSMKLSPNTVRNHISSILHKTGLQKQADVVAFVKSLASTAVTRNASPN